MIFMKNTFFVKIRHTLTNLKNNDFFHFVFYKSFRVPKRENNFQNDRLKSLKISVSLGLNLRKAIFIRLFTQLKEKVCFSKKI